MEYFVKTKNGEKIPMRDLQNEILEIMDEIHRVCVKNKIDYWLLAGTALGVCNYKGFIPWDDDIDIAVPRKDWNNFIKALKKDLDKEKFYFHCFETNRKFNIFVTSMKIRKRGTYIKEKNRLLRNYCDGDGIFVDAVIADQVTSNIKKDNHKRWVVRCLMPIVVFFELIRLNPIPLKKLIMWYAKRYADKNSASKFWSETIAYPWFTPPIFTEEVIYPLKLYEFEGRKYYSYNKIKEVCIKRYGEKSLGKVVDGKWEETWPEEKRTGSHTLYLNLNGEKPNKK